MESDRMNRLETIERLKELNAKEFYEVLHNNCRTSICTDCLLIHNVKLCNLSYAWSKV